MPIEQNARGQFIAVGEDATSLVVYGPTGKLVSRIGRSGEGPGEFARIQTLRVGNGDSIFVADMRRRLSVFSPEGRFVRSVVLPAATGGGVTLPDGSVVLAKQIRTPERAAFSYHVVGRNGTIIRSFGPAEPSAPGVPAVSDGLVLSSSGGQLWSLSRDFRLKSWSTGGQLLSDLAIVGHLWGVRPAPTMPNITATSPLDRARQLEAALKGPPGRARVNLAGIDERGLVWLNVFVPDRNASPDSADAHFLEVIDPVKGELLASQRVSMLNMRLMASPSGVRGYAAMEGADGSMRIDVWKLELVRRE